MGNLKKSKSKVITVKIFGDKKIIIREFQNKDLKNVKKFLEFDNSFDENDKWVWIEKLTLQQEKDFLNEVNKFCRKKRGVFIFAEHNNKIIGRAEIDLGREREQHVGDLGIKIKDGYRGIGLGTYLTAEIMRLAIEKLKPVLKCIRLETYSNNTPALNLYKKMGFKIYGRIPKQREYKGKLYDEVIMLKEVK